MAAHVCAAHAHHSARQVGVEHSVYMKVKPTCMWIVYIYLYVYVCFFVCVCVSSDGNLATKQVVFLQRPVRSQAAAQPRNQVR